METKRKRCSSLDISIAKKVIQEIKNLKKIKSSKQWSTKIDSLKEGMLIIKNQFEIDPTPEQFKEANASVGLLCTILNTFPNETKSIRIFIIEHLIVFNKYKTGFPAKLTSTRWSNIINNIQEALSDIDNPEKNKKNIKKNLELFNKYFNHLWI